MTAVRAYANSHGGDIELLGVDEEGNVEVRLRGACRGCPMADVTLRLGVERQLREQVPGVRKVRAI
jgi:Fe-S cluster biogenesis protein NfuA